jgi:hypothetical protein
VAADLEEIITNSNVPAFKKIRPDASQDLLDPVHRLVGWNLGWIRSAQGQCANVDLAGRSEGPIANGYEMGRNHHLGKRVREPLADLSGIQLLVRRSLDIGNERGPAALAVANNGENVIDARVRAERGFNFA